MTLDPREAVASFDSASTLHAALVAALEHRAFPYLGNPPAMDPVVRVASRLPWPLLRALYARIGGSEAVDSGRLGEIDAESVAASFAEPYRAHSYPAVMVGSTNGALLHLAAAMGVPWLPNTMLVPVRRPGGDSKRPDLALEFGRRVAPALLAANPGLVLHQMHDSVQDEIMTTRMSYFRVKWRELPSAYERFLATRLAPGAPLVVVEDVSTWPVTRVAERHTFQSGGRGGMTPDDHLALPHAPAADDVVPEAEWGADPGFVAAAIEWAREHGHPIVRISPDGPQQAAGPVAEVLRRWTRDRGGAADALLLPSFVLTDPWQTFRAGLVPFWTYFATVDVVAALDDYLGRVEPYRRIEITMFQHGADSRGRATVEQFEEVARRNGAEPHLFGLRRRAVPHDMAALARFTTELRRLPAGPPWRPLDVGRGLDALAAAAPVSGLRIATG